MIETVRRWASEACSRAARVAGVVALAMLCACTFGIALASGAEGPTGSRDLTVDTLRATRIVLGEEGQRAAAVLELKGGAAVLQFLDREGRVRLTLSGGDLGDPKSVAIHDAGLVIFDRGGSSRLQATVSADLKEWSTLRVASRGRTEDHSTPVADGSLTATATGAVLRLRSSEGETVFEKP